MKSGVMQVFEFFTALKIQVVVLSVVMPCSDVLPHRHGSNMPRIHCDFWSNSIF